MMPWKKIFNRVFFRTMLADFGFRTPNYLRQWEFTPYFQYRIGPYEAGYTLCFRRQPWQSLYKNEIFNKMTEYTGYDVTRYLAFHYDAFADKREFLQFVRYEVTERLKRPHLRKGSDYHRSLEIALEWVGAEEVGAAVVQTPAADAGEGFVALLEPRLDAMTQSFSGRISLTSVQHQDLLIRLFVLLQQVESPDKSSPLFKVFSDIDLAAILRQFDAFRDKKLNTLQKRISDCGWEIKIQDPRVVKMREALIEFFYGADTRP